jgi:tellurite resistance protein
MVDGYLGSLTTEERTLLHLLHHPLPKGKWEAPEAITQAGISAAVHVQRKHVPRTLKRLEKNLDLTITQRHIPGAKQKRRVYSLSLQGKERASELLDKIMKLEIVHSEQNSVIADIYEKGKPILITLSHLDEGMLYHETPVISSVSNPEGIASLDAQAGEELVRRMFATAWKDGKITKDEQQLLSDVVDFLCMHPERARRLSEEARGSPENPPPEEVYLDMLRQALIDGELADDEMALIKTFQIAFDIDDSTHERLMETARSEPALPENVRTYKATLDTAMEDGKITPDEEAMLRTLREALNVSMAEHASLLAGLRDQL